MRSLISSVHIRLYAAFVFLFFVCWPVIAQVASPTPTPSVTAAATSTVATADPNADFVNLLLQSLGGLKGAGALAVAGIVVQLLIKLSSTTWVGQWFPNLTGAWKLLIVTGLSLISGVLALMVPPTSLTLGAALLHSTTLTAFMVFGNQVYQQILQPASASPPTTKTS